MGSRDVLCAFGFCAGIMLHGKMALSKKRVAVGKGCTFMEHLLKATFGVEHSTTHVPECGLHFRDFSSGRSMLSYPSPPAETKAAVMQRKRNDAQGWRVYRTLAA